MTSLSRSLVFCSYLIIMNVSLNEINKIYIKNLNPPKPLLILNYSVFVFSSTMLFYTGREMWSDINKNL